MPHRHRALRLLAMLLTVTTLAGCAAHTLPWGDGVTRGPVDTSFIVDTDDGEADQLAAATLLDAQDYWRQAFPSSFGDPWRDLSRFFSIDTADAEAPKPPCVATAAEVEGNAYYCPGGDAIAWDRTALLPVLRERFGDAAVVAVLAHEVGHAVHNRLGIDLELAERKPASYPTILTEAMADCYTGSFMRWVTDGNARHLRIDRADLDHALGALVVFRDPLGTSTSDTAAHGNGFDRVSSFQDGYQQGPRACRDFSVTNRDFTQEQFTSLADQATGGNLPYDELVTAIVPDLEVYFRGVVTGQGGQWRAPRLRPEQQTPDCSGDQGPTAFCPGEDVVEVDGSGRLAQLHREVGDYATGLLLASRYGLAALQQLGRPIEGHDAGRAALCLAGAYSGELLRRTRGFGLSPGDLDEAVLVLLTLDYGSRDARGQGGSTGFDRVGTFRAGTLGGAAACGLG
ncbi:MAG: neutral zinc metallopeptidase [Pseudonocardiaceae bacterium]